MVASLSLWLMTHQNVPAHFFTRLDPCKTIDAFAFVPRASSVSSIKSTSTLSMKVFDWKRREADESVLNDVEKTEWTLDNLKPAPGSRQKKKRKGRGISAGQGATCGFGMRGQKARSGRPTRPGFEGGQNPLYRRLPKYVGKPMGPGHKKTIYNIIKTDELNGIAEGQTCNCESSVNVWMSLCCRVVVVSNHCIRSLGMLCISRIAAGKQGGYQKQVWYSQGRHG